MRSTQKSLGQRAMESRAIVKIYESRLWRRNPLFAALTGLPFDAELETIAPAAGIVGSPRRVLDLACGSGIYTRPFAHRLPAGRIIGLDLSSPMLDHARAALRSEGLSNVDLVRGSALSLPFGAASFEIVNCCGALHLFPDVNEALGEIARVLTPGGRFTAAVFHRRSGDDRGFRRLIRRWSGVASFDPEELEGRLAARGLGGFEVLHLHGPWLLLAGTRLPE
ncbi:MAG: methyltransferase domain-containing protein [bacterium]|nr:methyltransferase domain-containing protein [bacterium]